jgi:hypothetical protein
LSPALTGGIRNSPAAIADEGVDDRATSRQGRHCRFFIEVHEQAVSFYVGGEEWRRAGVRAPVLQ